MRAPNDRRHRQRPSRSRTDKPSEPIPPIGACFRRAGRAMNSRFVRIPAIPIRTRSSTIFPAPCAIARASRSRWSAVAGWKKARAGRAPRPRRVCSDVLGGGAGPARRRARPRAGQFRSGRGVRRLLWLVQRRPLSPRAEPGSPLPEYRHGRLRQLGQHLQFGRRDRRAAAHHRRLRGSDQAQRHLGCRSPSTAMSCSPSAAWR